MNRTYIKILFWFAFLCYAVPLVIYTSKLYHFIDINDIPQLLNYAVLSCAFLAFSIYTFNNALNKTKHEDDIKDTSSLYTSPARLGYGLMVLSFFITLAISWVHGEPVYFQRLIAIAGYLCLTFKIDIGIFIIIVFYTFSLIYALKITTIDYIYTISKAGLILYYSTYGYRYITKQGKIGKEIKTKLE
jgi:hypothetical protein